MSKTTDKTTVEAILEANRYGRDIKAVEDKDGPSGYWPAPYRTPILAEAAWLGYEGVDLQEQPVVSGYRYGRAPESGLSYNYADDKSERGLSLAALDTDTKEAGSRVWFRDRDVYTYTGILLPYTGSDGEPLILPEGFDVLD